MITEKAKQFATKAHGDIGQRRKYTGEPYINHPSEVVDIIKCVPHTEEMIAAAWLHDVVEDTPVTLEEIEYNFGAMVASYVYFLTDVSKSEDGNRKERKRIDREHIAKAPAEVKTIKIADLISNTSSILEYDPKFSEVYMEEKAKLLGVLTDGDTTLLSVAFARLAEYYRDLNIQKAIDSEIQK